MLRNIIFWMALICFRWWRCRSGILSTSQKNSRVSIWTADVILCALWNKNVSCWKRLVCCWTQNYPNCFSISARSVLCSHLSFYRCPFHRPCCSILSLYVCLSVSLSGSVYVFHPFIAQCLSTSVYLSLPSFLAFWLSGSLSSCVFVYLCTCLYLFSIILRLSSLCHGNVSTAWLSGSLCVTPSIIPVSESDPYSMFACSSSSRDRCTDSNIHELRILSKHLRASSSEWMKEDDGHWRMKM